MIRLFLLIAILYPSLSLAAGNTCVVSTTSNMTATSLSASTCSPADANDLWVLGNGDNEVVTVDFDTHTSGTYTLTFGGQTTSAITYAAGNGDAGRMEDALEALSTIGIGNVHVYRGAVTTEFPITFEGSLACTNVGAITGNFSGLGGAGSPTISVTTAGVAGNTITVTQTASVLQSTNAAAGINVKCNTTLVQASDALDIRVGPAGFTVDGGATVTLNGAIREQGVASPSTHAPSWQVADLWTVCGISDCSGNCGATPGELRLTWTAATCNSPTHPNPGDPYMDEAIAAVVVGDLVAFVPDYGCPDEGWMYEVTAADDTATPPYITIDVAQSITDQEGLDLVDKQLVATTLSANEVKGSTLINIQDAIVTADDEFTGRWVRIDGDDRMYQIGETDVTADTLTLIDRRGLQKAYSSTDSVVIHPDAIQSGCRFVVVDPVTISSATTGVTEALQGDSDVEIRGTTELQWVRLKETGSNEFHNVVTSTGLGPIWQSDGYRGTASGVAVYGMNGNTFTWLQMTGDADDNSGGCTDCRQHGLRLKNQINPHIDVYTKRHGADDCLVVGGVHGDTTNVNVDIIRCQYSTSASDSGQFVDEFPAALAGGEHTFHDAECVNCTSYYADQAPGMCAECNVQVTGGGYIIYMGSWGTQEGALRNTYAYRMLKTTVGMLPEEAYKSFFERPQSGTYPLNASAGIKFYDSVVYEPISDVNGFSALFSASNGTVPLYFNNVAIIKPLFPNNVTASATYVFLLANANDPSAEVGWVDTLVWCDADDPPDEIAYGWRANGPTSLTGVEVDGLAFVDCTGSLPWLYSMRAAAAAFASMTWGDGPFFYNSEPHTDQPASLPSTTVVSGGDPGLVDPGSNRFDSQPGGALDQASSGLRSPAGVCRAKRWHTWAQLPLNHACVGNPYGGGGSQIHAF
jgi:hypothetical protein